MFATANNNPARIVQKRQIGFPPPVRSTLLRTTPRGYRQSPASRGTNCTVLQATDRSSENFL